MKPPQRGWGLVSSFAPSLRSENLSLVRHQEVLSRRGPNGATSTPVLQTYVNRSCFTYVLTRSMSPKILACDWGSSIIGVVPITTLSRFTIGAERPLSSHHAVNPRPITRFLYMIESIYPRSTPPLVESLIHQRCARVRLLQPARGGGKRVVQFRAAVAREQNFARGVPQCTSMIRYGLGVVIFGTEGVWNHRGPCEKPWC